MARTVRTPFSRAVHRRGLRPGRSRQAEAVGERPRIQRMSLATAPLERRTSDDDGLDGKIGAAQHLADPVGGASAEVADDQQVDVAEPRAPHRGRTSRTRRPLPPADRGAALPRAGSARVVWPHARQDRASGRQTSVGIFLVVIRSRRGLLVEAVRVSRRDVVLVEQAGGVVEFREGRVERGTFTNEPAQAVGQDRRSAPVVQEGLQGLLTRLLALEATPRVVAGGSAAAPAQGTAVAGLASGVRGASCSRSQRLRSTPPA